MSEDNRVVIRRRMRATREELFDAWTDAEGMQHWMCPGDVVSAEVRLDPRVGGKVHFLMRSPTATYEHTGEYRIFERPSRLAFTWTANNVEGQVTLVTVQFLEISADETELVLTHEGIPRKDVSDRYQSGWGRIAECLENYIANRKHDIKHAVQIAAPRDVVYPLIATAAGLSAWWAADVTENDGAVSLGFFNRQTVYRLRPARHGQDGTAWKCETGQEWEGTQLVFALEPRPNGTMLRFKHAGWAAESDYFTSCNTTWGALMLRLKAAAEGKSPGPLFLKDGMGY